MYIDRHIKRMYIIYTYRSLLHMNIQNSVINKEKNFAIHLMVLLSEQKKVQLEAVITGIAQYIG